MNLAKANFLIAEKNFKPLNMVFFIYNILNGQMDLSGVNVVSVKAYNYIAVYCMSVINKLRLHQGPYFIGSVKVSILALRLSK